MCLVTKKGITVNNGWFFRCFLQFSFSSFFFPQLHTCVAWFEEFDFYLLRLLFLCLNLFLLESSITVTGLFFFHVYCPFLFPPPLPLSIFVATCVSLLLHPIKLDSPLPPIPNRELCMFL